MLQGSLDTFDLEDVVTFLSTTAKTGRLHLDGDRGTGSLWFASGDVVAAAAANVPLEADIADVVFELLRYGRGDFAFSLGEVAPAGGPHHAVAPLLHQARTARDEWRELTALVPSPEHVVALSAELVDGHVTLDRDQWRTILAISPWTTVAELGEAFGEGEVPVLRRVCDLLAKGLVELHDPVAVPAGTTAGPVEPSPLPVEGTCRWPAADTDVEVTTASDVPAGAAPAGAEVIDHTLLEQLGGLSPRAAQAVSEAAARGGADDSILMAMLRDEL